VNRVMGPAGRTVNRIFAYCKESTKKALSGRSNMNSLAALTGHYANFPLGEAETLPELMYLLNYTDVLDRILLLLDGTPN